MAEGGRGPDQGGESPPEPARKIHLLPPGLEAWLGVVASFTIYFFVGSLLLTCYDIEAANDSPAELGRVTEAQMLVQLGASIGQYIAGRRQVTESAYAVAIAPDERREARYFYPSTNGTYASTLTRLGVSMRGQFDHGKSRPD